MATSGQMIEIQAVGSGRPSSVADRLLAAQASRQREADRVETLLRRDRQDGRAARKRAAAQVEVARGRTVNIRDTAIPPTAETLRKGDYHEVEFKESRFAATERRLKNRGGTAVERWLARGDLSRPQAEAIALFARAWRVRFELVDRVTMNWSLVAGLRGGGVPFGEFVANQSAAKKLLEHLDQQVFFAFPVRYFEMWKRVVIEDEAAGVAGSRLGFKSKQAEAAAKAIVIMISDMIATDMRLG